VVNCSFFVYVSKSLVHSVCLQNQQDYERLRRRQDFFGGTHCGCELFFLVIDPPISLSYQVLRQGSFVTKMYGLQWTKTGFFDNVEDEVALQHANMRYHA
jgi:hypothetical protein